MARKRSNIQVLEKIRAAVSLCGFFVLCLDIRHCIRYNSLTLSGKSFKLLKYEVRELPKEAAIWMIIALYIAAMVWVGVQGARKTRTLTDFVVGGRRAGPWVSAFAYGTTYFSAVLFIGYAGSSGFRFGLWAVLVGLSNALIGALLAWKLLAPKTRDVTRRLKIKTMPQMFEKRYQSPRMKTFAALLIFIFMVPYSASVYSGLSYLCEIALGIRYEWAMLAIAAVAAAYLIAGGYIASLRADLIQGIVMIGGVLLMVGFVLASPEVGGFSVGMERLTGIMEEAGILSLDGAGTAQLIGLCLLTSVGTWGMPQMIQKFYGVADQKAIRAGTVISTAFCAVISVCAYFIGSLTRLFFTETPAGGTDQMIPIILDRTLPVVLLGVVLVLVLSASVSTLSGITLSACSAISMDLIAARRKQEDKSKTLRQTRVLCLVFIVLSFLIAVFKTPILTLMSFSWGTISGAFLAPYFLGLWWKRMNRTGAWAGMLVGAAVSLVLAAASGFDSGSAALFGVIAMASSFAACLIATPIGCKLGGAFAQVPAEFFDPDFSLQTGEGKQASAVSEQTSAGPESGARIRAKN